MLLALAKKKKKERERLLIAIYVWMVGIEFERKRQCPSNHDWQLVQFLSYEGLEFFFFFGENDEGLELIEPFSAFLNVQ